MNAGIPCDVFNAKPGKEDGHGAVLDKQMHEDRRHGHAGDRVGDKADGAENAAAPEAAVQDQCQRQSQYCDHWYGDGDKPQRIFQRQQEFGILKHMDIVVQPHEGPGFGFEVAVIQKAHAHALQKRI